VASIFGLPVTAAEADLIRRCTDRPTMTTERVREVWLLCGRRSGKSQIAALLAVYLGCFKAYTRSYGEKLIGMLVARDRDQARHLKDMIAGLLHAKPELDRLIVNELAEEIELSTGITIKVVTSNYGSVRGRGCAFVIADELGFWERADSSNPAAEVLRALRPTLATTKGLLICLTTPYAAEGPPMKPINATTATMVIPSGCGWRIPAP
jgi:phage terminase large subunit-like protein